MFNFTNIVLAGGSIFLSGQTDDKTGLILAFHNFLENSPTDCLSHAAGIGFDEELKCLFNIEAHQHVILSKNDLINCSKTQLISVLKLIKIY
jgi:hypothetical protein